MNKSSLQRLAVLQGWEAWGHADNRSPIGRYTGDFLAAATTPKRHIISSSGNRLASIHTAIIHYL
jgi:hypothetical protein